MRLLHIVSTLNPAAGGVSQAILTLIKGLTEKGVLNEVATIDNPAAEYIKSFSFRVYALGSGKTAWQYAPALLYWLKNNLLNYDAVIVHGLWQYQTYAARKAWKQLKGKRPKLLVMPHGMLDPYFQKAKGRKIKAIRNRVFWKWNEQRLVNAADTILFTCETEMLLAREPFTPYRPKTEKVVGLGVEAPPPFIKEMQATFAEKVGAQLPVYWLFISRIHEKKGTDLLISAYLQLKKTQPDVPPLVIAGPGLDTPFGKQMQQLAATDNAIYFPGMLTDNAKWGAFYGCEVFILPSHQENFGIAVVEALACGKPVLISNQVNIWREIEKEGAGYICSDTSAGVAELLKKWLVLPPKKKQQMATGTQACYQKNFSEASATDLFLKVLNHY